MNDRRKGLSDTLEQELRGYEIGAKVHSLRMSKKMGLVELGKHSGLSPALLSKIENSKIFPPLGTLLRIAMVFGVGLDHFFREDRSSIAIVRASDRQRFPNDPSDDEPSFFFESLDFTAKDRKMSSYIGDFQVTDPDDAAAHSHDGEEFIHVLEGRLGIRIGKSRYELDEGDSIYFDSSIEHAYWRAGKKTCRALVSTVR